MDILRGVGIFFLITLHTSLYFYSGIYDLDFSSPPPLVTAIGLLLMFAGLFALISGIVHYVQFVNKVNKGIQADKILKYNLYSGLFILGTAYFYFIFTGPALIKFEERLFDNSILIELISNGSFKMISTERLLYVDSLIMIGLNIIICAVVYIGLYRFIKNKKHISAYYLIISIALFALSIIRIPLYDIYLDALDSGKFFIVILLNFFVNKNNPILPFLAFGFFGVWIGTLLVSGKYKQMFIKTILTALTLLSVGIYGYINLPDTMLERSIDLKWYSIMTAQLGLFIILVILALYIFDFRKQRRNRTLVSRFLYRFGTVSLTVFVFESVLSNIVYRIMKLFNPDIALTMSQSIIFGFSMAVLCGLLLILWEKAGYKYGFEYYYVKLVGKHGMSSKEEKLKYKLK